jgi:hypothetical protein
VLTADTVYSNLTATAGSIEFSSATETLNGNLAVNGGTVSPRARLPSAPPPPFPLQAAQSTPTRSLWRQQATRSLWVAAVCCS